ncbi:MAG: hypothetical protein FMNOHCHN_00544 [Ignavibacteriaceae bacterium]|nr:hypothetical protein [Ignavibacteriaceae bacterium]
MKTTIRIQNFKSLEDVTLELAPTTVFLGPNGAGKSSVLQMMKLVGERIQEFSTYQKEKSDQEENKLFADASFKELVYNNDVNRKIIFEMNHTSKITLDATGFYFLGHKRKESKQIQRLTKLLAKAFEENVEFNQRLNEIDVSDFSKQLQKYLFDLYVSRGQNSRRNKLVTKYFDELDFFVRIQFGHINDSLVLESFSLIDKKTKSSVVFVDNVLVNKNSNIGFFSKNHLINEVFKEVNNNKFKWPPLADSTLEESIVLKAVKFFKSKLNETNVSEIEGLLIDTIVEIIKFNDYYPQILSEYLVVLYNPAIRPVPNVDDILKDFQYYKENDFNNYTIENTTEVDENDWQEDEKNSRIINADKISPAISNSEENNIIHGPFGIPDRNILEKISRIIEILKEIRTKTSKNSQEYREIIKNELEQISSQFDGQFLESETEFIINIRKWLLRLKLAKDVWVEINEKRPKLKVKTLSGVVLDYTECSSGFIQLFPIISSQYFPEYHFMSSPFRNILIQQPELHLHPALQSEIAELCSNNSPSSHSKTKYMIETHSEHLIRGYQLLIAKRKIKPEHIRFYYFNPTKGKTKVVNLKVDNFGNFITPWPNGFFSEASDLSYKLLEEQLKRQK